MGLSTIIREKWKKSKWGWVFFWSLLIFLGSSLPPVQVSTDTWVDFLLHKSVHFFEYSVLALLVWRASGSFAFSLLYSVFYAFTDELHQLFVFGRQGRWQDILLDSSAALLVNFVLYCRPRFRFLGKNEGVSRSVAETGLLAQKVAGRLKYGNYVALFGDLGSGKTTFVQGLAKALGVRETVGSPSFVLVKEYVLPKAVGRFEKLVHMDLYRLNSPAEVERLSLLDWVLDSRNLVVIEWAERWGKKLPEGALEIFLEYASPDRRRWRIGTQ